MSAFSVITKPNSRTASIFSLLVPSQNGVIQGSLHYEDGASGRAAATVGIPPRTDTQPRSPALTRPKILGVSSHNKMGKVENLNRVPALSLGQEEGDGSLPCSPDPGSPDYLQSPVCPGDQLLEVETRQLLGMFLRDYTGLSEVSRWNRNQSKALSTLKRVVDDVIDKHRLAYKGMISKLRLDAQGDDMSVVTSIAQQIFNDGKTNWGRIVSLVAFGACVCQHQKDSGKDHCVDLVAEEISTYLLSDQRDWMVKNNGWEGFVEFFRIADPESAVRNTLMAFAGVAGIGATLALLIR